jgi:hypothetical protein
VATASSARWRMGATAAVGERAPRRRWQGSQRGAGVATRDTSEGLAGRCRRGRQTVSVESSYLQNSVMPTFVRGARTSSTLGAQWSRSALTSSLLLMSERPLIPTFLARL